MNALPPPIRLYLFNAPTLEVEGAPVAVPRRKATALLAYLAVTGRSHLRDSLATLLWPDSGQSTARANLRHALVVLKQLVGEEALVVDWNSVALRQGASLWVDVLHFQALLAACPANGHAPSQLCETCLPLFVEATTYRAETFMAGFSLEDSPAFDDWQRSQQQQLTQALSDTLDRLVAYFVQGGEYKAAIDAARRRLKLDTLDEAAHRQLMQLYAGSGQQGLALRQFEQCKSILARELDVAPSAETMQLIQEIQTGRATEASRGAGDPQGAAGHPGIATGIAATLGGPSVRALERATTPQTSVDDLWRREESPRHNLPLRLPTLIGRDDALQAIQELLQHNDVNLLTIIGPGGVGKTQLSLHLAARLLDHFADGVFFVSLAPLTETESVVAAIAQTWGLERQSNRPLLEAVQSYLRHKEMLLILDNFEHLMNAAPLVSDLLAHSTRLRMVVTSRELLNVQGEHLYALAPLALPTRVDHSAFSAIAASPAVQLFVQRAQAVAPAFVLDERNGSDIADICTYLDGLPLAIELVAARVRLLPPHSLRQRLLGASTSSFELLQGGGRDAPLRHRTLRETITWSYELLTVAEQRLLRLLSIFAGGCTLEAIERTSELVGREGSDNVLEMLASLVNKSLLRQVVQPDGDSRFSLLEMIREFALEQLQATPKLHDEVAIMRRAHAETYAAFAEFAVPALTGRDHLRWIARLRADHENCRAALQWAITHQHADLAMRLAGTLWGYWLEQGYYQEGSQFLSAILQLGELASRVPDRARVLTGLGAMSIGQGNVSLGHVCLEEAIAIFREWDDERGQAVAVEALSEACTLDLDSKQVYQYYGEAAALYKKTNDRAGVARIHQGIGMLKYGEGDFGAAQQILEEALAIYIEEQEEAGLGALYCKLGRALFQQQKFAEATERFAEALPRAHARGDVGVVSTILYFLGRIAFYQGEHTKAKSLFEESLRSFREIGSDAAYIAFAKGFLSEIALAQDEIATAQTLLAEAIPLVEDDVYAVSLLLPRCAIILARRGNYRDAVQLVAASHFHFSSWKPVIPVNEQLVFDAPLALARPFLSAEEFDQAWAAGAQMTVDEAVALALAEIR